MSELPFGELLNQKYGRLTIISDGGYSVKKKRLIICQCDCGNKIKLLLTNIRTGHTKSCGCLNSELSKLRATKHNLYHNPLYSIWSDMRRRCYAKNRNGFCNYGGRGIVVCDEWRYDVSSFISWAERSGYKEGLHIDRKDVNGNYESSNCRWVTQKENNRNKRNNILTVDKASEIKDFFARNRNISKKDIAIHFGLKPSMIYDLLTGRSWL